MQRVAVFVDVENVLGWLKRGGCGELLDRARERGVVSVRRAYGDFSNPTVASRQVELQRHGFDLVHTLHPAKGKSNSADISMTIDVMECCRGPEVQWVVLATGDSDFGPVFRRLRELGKGVVGVGPSSVLSTSVELSCHDFIFTDNARRKGKDRNGTPPGGRAAHSRAAGREASLVRPRVATPPQLLSARGGFRIRNQPVPARIGPLGAAHAGAQVAGAPLNSSARLCSEPPLPDPPRDLRRLGPPVVAPEAAMSTEELKAPVPAIAPAPSPLRASPHRPYGEVTSHPVATKIAKPLLAPGQLLLPEMVGPSGLLGSKSPDAYSTLKAENASASVEDEKFSRKWSAPAAPVGGLLRAGGGGGGGRSSGLAGHGGQGTLSVIRPSERLYRHLLALESPNGAGTSCGGSIATDWGEGLSEVTLAKGLVSLAEACGGKDREHTHAVASLVEFVARDRDASPDTSQAEGGGDGGLEREEAFRVARLLQRCGFLSWVPEEQQWLVTVPSDVEVLRRRRDDAMLEDLVARCQKAGVVFEPAFAKDLLWSKQPC